MRTNEIREASNLYGHDFPHSSGGGEYFCKGFREATTYQQGAKLFPVTNERLQIAAGSKEVTLGEGYERKTENICPQHGLALDIWAQNEEQDIYGEYCKLE